MLGVKTDEEVSQLTGHPLSAVVMKRQQLGRSKPNPIMDYWTPEQDKLLGTMPDRQLGKRLGRSTVAVTKRRLKLGVEYRATLRLYWPDEALALLGKLPDEELAKRMGCTAAQVKHKRTWRNIPPYTESARAMERGSPDQGRRLNP